MVKRLLTICLAVAAAVFFVTEPFAVLDSNEFWASVTEQSEMVRRIRDYPYTRQYIDTQAYSYPIVQLGEWGLGPALGVVAWAGLAFATGAALIKRKRGDILLLSWVLPYFALTGAFEVKFLEVSPAYGAASLPNGGENAFHTPRLGHPFGQSLASRR